MLQNEFRKSYFRKIESFLSEQLQAKKQVFPPQQLIFNALNLTPLNAVKVVVIGQDPYHDNGQVNFLWLENCLTVNVMHLKRGKVVTTLAILMIICIIK